MQRHSYQRTATQPISLNNPIFLLVKLVRKVHLARENVELVKHSGREEDSFAGMIFRICCEFPFCKLKNRVPFIH